MRLRRFAAVPVCLLLLLACLYGCAEKGDLMEVRIAYCAVQPSDGSTFAYMTRRIAASEGERLCSLVLQLAMTEPENEGLTSVFPRRTAVRSVEISGRGILTVDFSKPYGTLEGIERTVADYCTVLTLFALDSVSGVKINGVVITVEGEGEHIVMTPDDVVDNTNFMRLRDYEFVIYFPNRNEKTLETDVFSRTLSDAEQPAETIVSILMGGRRSDGSINHIVSDSTTFLGLEIRNRVCYLDFNESFFSVAIKNDDGESLKLYAFVNSLCELPYIDRVQFLINGEVTDSELYEDFDSPYSPNFSLVA